jgi:hypothetical protein
MPIASRALADSYRVVATAVAAEEEKPLWN